MVDHPRDSAASVTYADIDWDFVHGVTSSAECRFGILPQFFFCNFRRRSSFC